MKRYASHFIFLPKYGCLKQYVVETERGFAVRLFPLTEEIEDVEWLPGAIVLLKEEDIFNIEDFPGKYPGTLMTYPLSIRDLKLKPIYLLNFDIRAMLPVAGTRHRQLL